MIFKMRGVRRKVVDLHCHILPGADDGAVDMDQALRMACLAWERGTTTLVATPHCGLPGKPGNFRSDTLAAQFRALQSAVSEMELPLRILPGMEFFGGEDLRALYEQGSLLPLAGSRYLLVEFYFDESAYCIERVLQQAEDCGLVPVIAHPERYDAIQRRPERVEEWFHRGRIVQINKGSVLGDLGGGAEETAWTLLQHGLVHAVASDAHSDVRRTPDLSRVRGYLEQEIGEEYTQLLLEGNPRRIVENKAVLRELP